MSFLSSATRPPFPFGVRSLALRPTLSDGLPFSAKLEKNYMIFCLEMQVVF